MNLHAIIERFDAVAGDIITSQFTPDCCLNATRVTIEVFKHFGIKATPMSVGMLVWNAKWCELTEAKGGQPESREESDAWVEQGAWALGIDRWSPNRPGKWSGHLIALVPGHLIDASVGQMNRPQKGIPLPQVFIGTTEPRFVKGKGTAGFKCENDAVLSYMAFPKDRSFLTLPGFQPHEGNLVVAAAIIDAMKRFG